MSFVALITGASSGIGEATARLFPSRKPHAEIILVARRQDRIDALAAELNAADPSGHSHFHPYAADLTDPAAVDGLARYVSENFGHLNLLVNNAGARWSQNFADGGYGNVAQTMEINFDAQVRVTEAFLPLLREGRPEASIVNVASTAGKVGRAGAGAYSASKFALVGWTDSLHLELKAEGIHVGVVNPGFIATEGFPAREFVDHPLKKHMVGTAEQAADAVLRAGLDGKAEVFVPGFYWLFAVLRTVAPGVMRKLTSGEGFTTRTAADAEAADPTGT